MPAGNEISLMKCINCGAEIPDDSHYCPSCGERQTGGGEGRLPGSPFPESMATGGAMNGSTWDSPLAPALPPAVEFPAISITRLILLSFFSLGFYQIYWIYLCWQALAKAGRAKVSPFWRTSLIFFYAHDFMARIFAAAEEQGFKPLYSSWILASAYVGAILLGSFWQCGTHTFWWGLLLGEASVLALLPVQQAVNFYHAKATHGAPLRTSLGAGEIVTVALGFLLLLLSLLALSLSSMFGNLGGDLNNLNNLPIPGI